MCCCRDGKYQAQPDNRIDIFKGGLGSADLAHCAFHTRLFSGFHLATRRTFLSFFAL